QFFADVDEATNILVSDTAPKSAKKIMGTLIRMSHRSYIHELDVTQQVHRWAINLRYLGIVYRNLKQAIQSSALVKGAGLEKVDPHREKEKLKEDLERALSLFLIEAIARIAKNTLRRQLQLKMKEFRVPMEVPYRRVVVEFMNRIFSSKLSKKFWGDSLQEQLHRCFSFDQGDIPPGTLELTKMVFFNQLPRDTEKDIYFSGRWILFQRLCSLTGMVFGPDAKRRFKGVARWNSHTPVDFLDLKSIGERVKFMDVVDIAEASFFEVKGLTAEKRSLITDSGMVEDLFTKSLKRFETALISAPNNCETLFSCARVGFKVLQLKARQTREKIDQVDSNLCDQISLWLKTSNETRPGDKRVLLLYAQYLDVIGKVKEAEEKYLDCLEVDPSNLPTLVSYGNFLLNTGREDYGKEVLGIAGTALPATLSGSAVPIQKEENRVSFRVYLEDGTHKTISAGTAASSLEVRLAAQREIVHYATKYYQTTEPQVAQLSSYYALFRLHEVNKAQNLLRLIPDDERPWITVLQRPGNKSTLALRCASLRALDQIAGNVPNGLIHPIGDANNYLLRIRYAFSQLAVGGVLEQLREPLGQTEVLEPCREARSAISEAMMCRTPMREALKKPKCVSKLQWHAAHVMENFRLLMLIVASCSKECQCEHLSASASVSFSWDSNNQATGKKSPAVQHVDVSAAEYIEYFVAWASTELTSFYSPALYEKKLPKDLLKSATFRISTFVHRLHKIYAHFIYRHWNWLLTFLFSDLISLSYLHLYWLSLDFDFAQPKTSPEIFGPLIGNFKEWSAREIHNLQFPIPTPNMSSR
ncbi:MAG: Mob1/phocein family protein, partial [archaeon]|nr:Mob1/phocein family protein [archaeon]